MKKLIITTFSFLFFAIIFVGASNAQTNNPTNSTPNRQTEQQVPDEPLKIEKKPFARTDGRCSAVSGTVRIKATFDKSGKVTEAVVVSPSSCNYFDKEAVRVAKKIKFKPAMKNGEPVTVVKTIEYTFTIG